MQCIISIVYPQLIRIGGTKNFFRSLRSRIHYFVPPIMELVAPPLVILCPSKVFLVSLGLAVNQQQPWLTLSNNSFCQPSQQSKYCVPKATYMTVRTTEFVSDSATHTNKIRTCWNTLKNPFHNTEPGRSLTTLMLQSTVCRRSFSISQMTDLLSFFQSYT